MVLTYDRKNYYQKKKVQSSGRPCFFVGSNYNWKKLQPEKKGTVVWQTVEIHVFWRVQITTRKNYDPKKKVQSSGRWLKYTHFAWAGGTFFPVVLLFQFFVLAGNRFWFYILLMYLEYHAVVVLC